MSRKDAVLLASRTLAVLLTVWVLVEVSYLPGEVHSFLRYNPDAAATDHVEYMRHTHFISLGFLITRIVGLSLMARWLHKCDREVESMLLPSMHDGSQTQE